MAELPTPGGDDGTWGDILNEYLSISLDSAGRIKNLWFNVKDYGATGDGETDDAAAIQSAIDAASTAAGSSGGATVLFPHGSYLVSETLTVQTSNVNLMGLGTAGDTNLAGEGQGSGTLITPAAAFANDTYVLDITSTSPTNPLSGNQIKNIRIGKVATLSNTVHGLHYGAYRGVVEDVFIDTVSGHGIVYEGKVGWNLYETKTTRLQVRGCGQDGLRLTTGATDMHFDMSIIHGCANSLHGVGGASNHFVNCHFYSPIQSGGSASTTGYNIWYEAAGSRSKFIGCKVEGADNHGVYLDGTTGGGSTFHFLGCNFNHNGDATANTYDQFHVGRTSGSGSYSGILVGCSFQITSGSWQDCRYHVNFANGTANTWKVNDCLFDSNADTGNINVSSSAVRVAVNGLGFNVGDPSSTGGWNGQIQEGICVVDTGTNTIYMYANGGWRTLT